MGRRIQITESQLRYIIKNVNRIDEQQSKTEDYGKYEFGGAFANNYITPNTSSTEYQNTLKQMKTDLQKALSEKKKLSDLKIIIRSSASSNPATNGYAGSTPPNHNFVQVGKTDGGLLPKNGWVVSKAKGWQNITDQIAANTFLAQNRGIGMRDALVKDLNSMGLKITPDMIQLMKREDGKWVADSKDPSEQYVKVEIGGLLTPPNKPKKYPYQIIYDWYQLGGTDTPYVLIDGGRSYDKYLMHQNYPIGYKKIHPFFEKSVNSSGDDVKIAGYSKEGKNNTAYEFFAFGTFDGFISREGSVFYYSDEKSWMEDVKKINSMNPAEEFTMRQGDVNSKEKVSGVKAKGFWNPKKGGSANFHHGSGTNIPNGKLYLLKPKSSEGKVVTATQVSQGVQELPKG